MRLVRPLVDEDWSRSLVDELKWLGGVLGPVRDIDVLHGNLRESAGALADDLGPFFAWLEDRREGALGAAREALDSPRFDNLLERVLEGAHAPHLTPMAERPCHEVLPPLARGAWNKASRHARGLDSDASAKALHRLRILTKRARYAAELIGPALSAKRATSAARFASRARSVQDLLGRVQDSVVARSALTAGIDALSRDKAVVLAAGRLFERQGVAAGEARSSLPETWGKLDRPPLRVWMQS
jgi:CHAD domain-containing protein